MALECQKRNNEKSFTAQMALSKQELKIKAGMGYY
jgi:hypothetical protein